TLAAALPALRDALVPGGRLGVITYHSGEDRIVKHAFREWGRECICPPRQPICTCRGRALGRVLTKKAVYPSPDAIASNPRARKLGLRLPADTEIILIPAPTAQPPDRPH